MKTMLIAFALLLCAAFTSQAQHVILTVDNFSGCDVDITVQTLDGSCGTVSTFGTQNVLPGNSADFADENLGSNVTEYEVIITVDPNGTPVTLPPLTTTGNCGGSTFVMDPSACGGLGASANTTGSFPQWTVTIL